MKRNSTTLFLTSPGATTPISWVEQAPGVAAPDFSSFTNPTLSVLQQSWQQFLDSGEELEIIPDPVPVVEPPVPDWDSFNVYMLSDPMFKTYRDTVRTADGELTGALFDAYAMIDAHGVNAFSNIWGVWVSVSGISEEDRGIIVDVARSYNLPDGFVSIIEVGS